MHAADNSKRKGQGGMALVMVLGVLAVTLLLVVHIMTVCEVIGKEALVTSKRLELRYQAESAADHAFWMHLTDRRLYPSRKLGSVDALREDSDFEPWMADRREHDVFDANCQVYINTVEKSISITNPDTLKANVPMDDTETRDALDNFIDVLNDYTDNNSFTRIAGKEEDDYAAEGYASMPRDAPMQFVQELYWLDGWTEAVTGEVTIIPPAGKQIAATGGKTSFFSASPEELRKTMDLTDAELRDVLEARKRWISDGVELSDSLPVDLTANIMSKFNFNETNYADFSVSSATEEGEIRVIYNVVREVNMSKATIFADKRMQAFSIWNRTLF